MVDKYKFSYFSRDIVIIWFFISTVIILKSIYGQSNGYIAPDSKWFLKAASNIFNYKFLFFEDLYIYQAVIPQYKNQGSFFAAWPPLYPLLIALVSKISFMSFFWSSKLINIFCSLILIIILKKKISSNLLIIFILFNATFLEIASYTLTEYLFITLILLSLINLKDYINKKNKISLFSFFIYGNLLFFLRYNGLFIQLVAMSYIFFIFFYKKKLENHHFLLFSSVLISICIASSWCIFVKELTGFYTGYPRPFRDSFIPQIFYLIKAIFIEANYIISSTHNSLDIDKNKISLKLITYFLIMFLQLIPIFFFKNEIKFNSIMRKLKSITLSTYENLVLLTAFIYLFTTIIICTFKEIDPIYFRSISPASFLLFYLFCSKLDNYKNQIIKIKINYYLFYLISLTIIFNLFFPIYFFL